MPRSGIVIVSFQFASAASPPPLATVSPPPLPSQLLEIARGVRGTRVAMAKRMPPPRTAIKQIQEPLVSRHHAVRRAEILAHPLLDGSAEIQKLTAIDGRQIRQLIVE